MNKFKKVRKKSKERERKNIEKKQLIDAIIFLFHEFSRVKVFRNLFCWHFSFKIFQRDENKRQTQRQQRIRERLKRAVMHKPMAKSFIDEIGRYVERKKSMAENSGFDWILLLLQLILENSIVLRFDLDARSLSHFIVLLNRLTPYSTDSLLYACYGYVSVCVCLCSMPCDSYIIVKYKESQQRITNV